MGRILLLCVRLKQFVQRMYESALVVCKVVQKTLISAPIKLRHAQIIIRTHFLES
jgi:hypothetical protein